MCVHERDLDRLFELALRSCVRNLQPRRHVRVVCNCLAPLQEFLARTGLAHAIAEISEDADWLSSAELALPGWYRQQIIKLRAHRICETAACCCLGADTLLLRPVEESDLLKGGRPILYFNRYPEGGRHLEYERARVRHVGALLGLQTDLAYEYGDFIFDLFCFDRDYLHSLEAYLHRRHGPDCFAHLLEGRSDSPAERGRFGEWTLYSVYVLARFAGEFQVENSDSRYLRQVHRAHDLTRFRFDSKVVHFVDKSFDVQDIRRRLHEHGCLV